MLRRRRPTPPAADQPGPAPLRAADLAAQGWLVPAGALADPSAPAWTLVGTVDSPLATPVDPAGLVVAEGWSVDWWVGADDRWHLPGREAAVRQDLVADAPVVETRLRVPGGDAVGRAFAIRGPRGTGDEWVVVEVANETPVPMAVALVVRPFTADALGGIGAITVEPVAGGRGPDEAHLVRVDGRPALVVPRRPSRVVAGDRAGGDVVGAVTDPTPAPPPDADQPLPSAACPDGLATLALVFPLPHTATLRAVLPVGEVDPAEAIAYPSALPDAATVASGWDAHRGRPRLEVPDQRMATALARARAQLPLAHDGTRVRRDGHRADDLDPAATAAILGAFDVLDRPAEVGTVVARWPDRPADAGPELDTLVLTVVSRHWLLHRVDALLDWMLPEVAAAVERLDRADRRGRLADPSARRRAQAGLVGTRTLLAATGQEAAAEAVAALVARLGSAGAEPAPTTAADRLARAADLLGAGDPAGLAQLDEVLAGAGPTTTWPGPGPGGRPVGQDLAAAAGVILAVRALLVAEGDDGLVLLPVLPERWYGGGIEVHEAPTACGRLSYAVRWHGTRPALLWELDPHPGIGAVRITAPGLDPGWSTTEVRGDALLGEVAPPAAAEALRLVPDHPDIDPAMRRPGRQPEAPPGPLPEGGSFS